jgi:hypothetical protein
MTMPVMNVRIMGMSVDHTLVPMRVRMRLSRWVPRRVLVSVVFIVDVRVSVLERLMFMPMLVPLTKVEPESQRHQSGRGQKQGCRRLPIQYQAQSSSNERRQREIRPGPCGSERSQREYKAHQADAIPKESHHEGRHQGYRGRQPSAERNREAGIHRSCNESFELGNLERVRG